MIIERKKNATSVLTYEDVITSLGLCYLFETKKYKQHVHTEQEKQSSNKDCLNCMTGSNTEEC